MYNPEPLTGSLVPGTTAHVYIGSRGFDRHVSTVADTSGNFTAFFDPLPNEAGIYAVVGSHPDVVSHAAQSSFTIIGFGFEFSAFTARLAQNSSFKFTVSLVNTGETSIEGLTSQVTNPDNVPSVELILDPASLPPTLSPGAKVPLALTARTEPGAGTGKSHLNLIIREKHGFRRELPVFLDISPAQVIARATPQAFELGMLAGEVRTKTIMLENLGFETWRGVHLTSPTLAFAKVLSVPDLGLGDIPPNGNASFVLSFEPPLDTPTTTFIQNPLLEVRSSNAPTIPINAGISVTTMRQGTLVFNVINADIARDSSTGQGFPVAGAIATLTSVDVSGLRFQAAADSNGIARFMNIPSGNYAWRMEAKGFQPNSGTEIVEPGRSKTLETLLTSSFVTYEWSVTPTTIIDKYDIQLNLTFKTDVPAPVIVVEPVVISLFLEGGQSAFAQYTVTNKGLVSAFNVNLKPRGSSAMRVELPFTTIPELKPQQSIVVPLRIDLSHASCEDVVVDCDYNYACAAGNIQPGSCQSVIITAGNTCGIASSPVGGGVLSGGAIGGGGGGAGFATWIQQISRQQPVSIQSCPGCQPPPTPPPSFQCTNTAVQLPIGFNWQIQETVAGGGIQNNVLNAGDQQGTLNVLATSPCSTAFQINVIDNFPDGDGITGLCTSSLEMASICILAAPATGSIFAWTKANEGALGGGRCADATRHAIWMCSLTSALGTPIARRIGDAHENDGLAGGQGCAASSMDLSNNDFSANNLGPQARDRFGAFFNLEPCREAAVRSLGEGSLVANQPPGSTNLIPTDFCALREEQMTLLNLIDFDNIATAILDP